MAARLALVRSPPSGLRRALPAAFTFLCHGVAFFVVLRSYQSEGTLLQQLKILIIASVICAGLALVFRSRTILAYTVVFRLFVVVLAAALLGGNNVVAEILLLVPFIVEATDRFLWAAGLVLSSFAVFCLLLADLLSLARGDPGLAIQHDAILLMVSMPISLLGCVLSRTSDQLEERSKRISELGRAVENLTSSNKAFQDYAETIGSLSTEQERNRITRELHDLTGYALTNIIMLMNAGRVFLQEKPEKLREVLDNTKDQADSALSEIRRILYELRAVKTPALTGLHAVSHLVRSFSDATSVKVSMNYGNFRMSYGEQVDEVVYRIIQESLTNALRHGKAQQVTILLWETETDLVVTVSDNGTGTGDVHEGIGLKGIRERLTSLGGTLQVLGTRYGFQLVSRIPFCSDDVAKAGIHGPDQDHDC